MLGFLILKIFYTSQHLRRDLRHDRIAEGFDPFYAVLLRSELTSVQFSGKPIIHSTKSGCNLKPVVPCTTSPKLDFPRSVSPARLSCAFGVGRISLRRGNICPRRAPCRTPVFFDWR